MLIRCPYPNCLFTYEPPNTQIEIGSYAEAICPKCQKQGTAISLEILTMLEKRAKEADINQCSRIQPVNENTFQVLIENMRSLWNVGSIFRTSDAAGVSALYLCGITGCPPQKQISKTALGAEQTIPWQYYVHPLDIIPKLKKQGIIVLGLERNNKSSNLTDLLRKKKIVKPICLVVGNEIRGLSPETIDHCDYICSLPMKGQKESLNAAVAFGIAAYLINECDDTTAGAKNVCRR